MRKIKLALFGFIGLSACTGLAYFSIMYTTGNISISRNNQDWGNFGAYIGGILAPAASLLAGYLIYQSFYWNAYQQKLTLARESITRLDIALEKSFNTPFNNNCMGEEYYGLPLRKVIIAASQKEIIPDERMIIAILSLLHNIAILATSIDHYIKHLDKFPSSDRDRGWLGDLERSYWIESYTAICGRMIKIVSRKAFEEKVSEHQRRSFYFLFDVRASLNEQSR
ncbi:hypothetical protein [Halopseudomonas bauzanensis]|uniref:hypothetical protein n=1 Tax=Halopseudomonas bauzanensis TaxID=653930 RepID=UPI0025539598|nr:hypothetical protein [Halopseudomonas bauzanensis]